MGPTSHGVGLPFAMNLVCIRAVDVVETVPPRKEAVAEMKLTRR